jgi:hypothetical protein
VFACASAASRDVEHIAVPAATAGWSVYEASSCHKRRNGSRGALRLLADAFKPKAATTHHLLLIA